MEGQGAIIGVGALEYPAEWQGASTETLNRNAVSKILTLTCTYDHRIIQGAQSGDFLRVVHQLLLGEHGFYDEIFESLRIPYEPIRWVQDISADHDDDVNKTARVQELIHAYRVRGHLMADTDPLEYRQRRHPDLDVATHGLTLWDLDRDVRDRRLRRRADAQAAQASSASCATPTAAPSASSTCTSRTPSSARWIQAKVEVPLRQARRRDEQLRILRRLNAAEAFETFLQTKFVGQKRFSPRGRRVGHRAARPDPVPRRGRRPSTRSASACRTAAGSTCWPTSPASPTARSSASSRASRTRSRSRAPAT